MFVCVWLQPVGKENETKEQIKALSQTHTWISTFFCTISTFTWSGYHPHPKHEPLKATAYLYENTLGTDLLGCWSLLPNKSCLLWSARSSKAPSSFENTILAITQRDLSSTYLKWVVAASHVIFCSSMLIWREVPIPAASPCSANMQTWCFRSPTAT